MTPEESTFFEFDGEQSHYYYRYCPECDERTFVRSAHPDSVEIDFCAVCGDGVGADSERTGSE